MNDIICPKCNSNIKPDNNWDFSDGEEHKIICCCGFQFTVVIERPIEYYVLEGKSGGISEEGALKL